MNVPMVDFMSPMKKKQKVLYEPRNPIGRGFSGKKSDKELKGMLLPNLEEPARLIKTPRDHPPPACFAFIAPSWEPRKSFAGTYDMVWQQKRSPYLPEDFESRFFNVAHPELICSGYLKGGEPVKITNMSPRGQLEFYLPICEFDAALRIAGKTEYPAFNLETVLFEPNEMRISLLWRTSFECDKKGLKVEEVDLNLKKLQINGRIA